MNKKVIIPTILFIIVLIFSVMILLENKESNHPVEQSQIILFYGDGCPHCAIVENYIKENNVKDKLPFEEKEIYYNQKNENELVEKAKLCGIPTNLISIPFLWEEGKCYVGDQEIIGFFNQKINKK